MILALPLAVAWARLDALACLEEADDDTHRAWFRLRGRTVCAAFFAEGERTRVEVDDPEVAALLAGLVPRLVAASVRA